MVVTELLILWQSAIGTRAGVDTVAKSLVVFTKGWQPTECMVLMSTISQGIVQPRLLSCSWFFVCVSETAGVGAVHVCCATSVALNGYAGQHVPRLSALSGLVLLLPGVEAKHVLGPSKIICGVPSFQARPWGWWNSLAAALVQQPAVHWPAMTALWSIIGKT